MHYVRFVLCLVAVCQVRSALAADDQLMSWFKDHAEVLVMLKNLDRLASVSGEWQAIKDSPQVAQDRKDLQSALAPSTTPRVVTDFKLCTNDIDCVPSDSVNVNESSAANETEKVPLTTRVELLETGFNKLDEACRQLASSSASQLEEETEKALLNQLKHWMDNYDSDMRWVRSQFTPLNYLFDKMTKMEQDLQRFQDNIANHTMGNGTFDEETLRLPLQDFRAKIQLLSEQVNDLATKMLNVDAFMNGTAGRLQTLQKQIQALGEKRLLTLNGTEEEYCPERLDESVVCAEIGESCYCFSKEKRNWTSSFEYCRKNDMHLLSLETQRETELLHNYIKLSGLPKDFYWTSGSDELNEGQWIWASVQQNLSYTNWRTNQPDGGKKENCLYLHSRDEHRWGDFMCHLSQHFICEW